MALLVLVLLLLAGAFALQRWIGTDDFKSRVEREASAALGVGVQLGRIDVTLWPLPAVALGGIQIQTRPALTLERVELRPAWSALMQGRLALDTVLVRRAVLPQTGVDAMVAALQKKKLAAPEGASSMLLIPQRTVLDDVTWLNAKGVGVTIEANARLNADGLPDDVSLKVLKGQLQGLHATLQRDGNAWAVALDVGGGTARGKIHLQPAPQAGGEFSLKGQLDTKGVDVAVLRGPLSGRLEAVTTFSARTASIGALGDVLHTESKFTVQKAVLHGVDLARAVKTVGLSRGGETPLDTLAGQVNTQGRAVQLNNLVASSGSLSASGHVAIAPSHALSGQVSVALTGTGGAVGVPLVVGGTLDVPEVTLTRGAMIGAAVGTVLAPGVGTGAGAALGGKVGEGFKKLFGQ